MKLKIPHLFIASILLAIASTSFAGPKAGDRSFSISGTGTGDKEFDNSNFGATGAVGWFYTPNVEYGVRQSFSWSDRSNGGNDFNGSTRGFIDYHFREDKALRPFVGASLGYLYGDTTSNSFIAGPEVGLRYYIQPRAFINTSLEYQFLFDDGDDADNSFNDGVFIYGLGLGILF
jgi:hypothetical protein